MQDHSAADQVARSSLQEGALRALNFTVASVSLLLLSPILLLIAVAIKLDSPGPIFYNQLRVGLDRRDDPRRDGGGRRTADLGGRPFLIHKFRTLHTDAENGTGPTWGTRDDDRCTRVGRFLRRHRLDELPQLWNVVKGDMAIVGPRPERPGFVNVLRDRVERYHLRQKVRPGITGWAQVNQDCDQSVDDVRRKTEYDLEYLQRRSIIFDLWIMLQTPRVMLATADDSNEDDGTEASGEAAASDGGAEAGVGDGVPQIQGGERVSPETSGPENDSITLLLGSDRRWFTTALESVLEPEGFDIVRASTGAQVVQYVEEGSPDLVLLDEDLPRVKIPELCRTLVQGPLPLHVPLVLYTPGLLNEELASQAVRAGAWAVFHEPIRATFLVAALRRLHSIGRLVATSREQTPLDVETGLLTLAGLLRALPPLGALAAREKTKISCAVVGPTRVEEGNRLRRQRKATADLCARNLRGADVCGWLNQQDLAIVAYDTSAEGAQKLVERLNDLTVESSIAERGVEDLSAGIVELDPPEDFDGGGALRTRRPEEGGLSPEELEELYSLAAAESALQSARSAGGGIQVTEVA